MDIEDYNASNGFSKLFQAGNTTGWNNVAAWTNEFIARLKQGIKRDDPSLNVTPIVYTTQNYAQNLATVSPSLTSYPLWVASADNDPNFVPKIAPWSNWAIMQWKWTSNAVGVSGDVDLDVLNSSTSLSKLQITQATSLTSTSTSLYASSNPVTVGPEPFALHLRLRQRR